MSTIEISTDAWDEAVARLAERDPQAAASLRSADWARVPLALRERAFFSSGVGEAHILEEMRSLIRAELAQERGPDGRLASRQTFVAQLRNLLGAEPGDSGDLTDLTSWRRLELVHDFQVADAREHARWKAGLDTALLDEFPAQELVRVEDRERPRDWRRRWIAAGDSVGWEGAMRTRFVALKTSPIWAALSRFGRPWPPFDYSSGMGLEDVDRDEAEALGLLDAGDPTPDGEAAAADFARGLEQSVRDLDPATVSALQEQFGPAVEVVDGAIRWRAR